LTRAGFTSFREGTGRTAWLRVPGGGSMTGAENEPFDEAELREVEGIVEHHKALSEATHVFGVFTSFCVPRLLATIRNLQRDLELLKKERDDTRAFLHNLTG
jgi:hypothetical protein